ncbi:hypothetical protein CTEN210_18340 [Chaetoceros tenuissimus]|uniref:Leucine-rich repeat domain-containing protein n=1 Tax=Chaetoceros tenuissimus TaxID=426638 RepID=A0AAD3HG14_9STRA|nr:hypothetical protein CTEN210_18340 [Chaetoceros tenuissimus]
MRVQTEEWRRFVPGVRMYKGKKTLFYNGENLWDTWTGEFLVYDKEEQLSWEVIIILPGVEVISEATFLDCENIEAVIMSDTVKRIEQKAFEYCESLSYISLSRNLEFIGYRAFNSCVSLTSIFIPPSCTEIVTGAFACCEKLIILHVPQDTELGQSVITDTALIRSSLFETYTNDHGIYDDSNNEVNDLIKNINGDTDEHALHRACSSFNPLDEVIFEVVKRQGIKAIYRKNELGITPLQYLQENPFADISQIALMKRYVLDLMGEVV